MSWWKNLTMLKPKQANSKNSSSKKKSINKTKSTNKKYSSIIKQKSTLPSMKKANLITLKWMTSILSKKNRSEN